MEKWQILLPEGKGEAIQSTLLAEIVSVNINGARIMLYPYFYWKQAHLPSKRYLHNRGEQDEPITYLRIPFQDF